MPEKTAEQKIFEVLNPVQETPPSDTVEQEPLISRTEETVVEATEIEPERYTVNPNGEEQQVTLEELKLGYMRTADYEKKLKGSRSKREKAEQLETTLTNDLADAKSMIEMELKDLEADKELKDIDPEEYWKRVNSVQSKAEKFKKLKAKEQKRVDEKYNERIKKEQELLTEAIPDWLNADTQKSETNDIIVNLTKSGFTDNEIGSLSDHRLFVLARKAMLFDKIQSQDLSKSKVKTPPKAVKPGSTNKQPIKATSAREKLQQTGSMRDAAAAIRELMN